jgi:endoglucanase
MASPPSSRLFSVPMLLLHVALLLQIAAVAPGADAIRVNQLGYEPDAPKVAVLCSVAYLVLTRFSVVDASGTLVLSKAPGPANRFGPCLTTYRLDFSSIKKPGEYRVLASGLRSPIVRIRENAYAGAADTLLY